MKTIRELFSDRRPIDRPIEKVIDYTADEPERLAREIDEYEVTDRLEEAFRRFIEVYEAGVRRGDVTEVGIWNSGFYGSGKTSFTKNLGFALDPERLVQGVPFIDRLVERFRDGALKQLFRVTAAGFPATVVMLDLARDQLVESTAVPVANVLYAKVLQKLDYSMVPKLADLEVRLDEQDQLDAWRATYRERFPGKGAWEEVHDDPLIGPARAAQLVPTFLSEDFPTPESFRQQNFQERLPVAALAERMIRLLRRKTGRDQIVFLVDEVGQYVARSTDLMLNLDGLVRSFKELGRGKVWFIATAQQTLSEIVEKALLNSAELYRLRDRFPISIELDAADIREITRRRLLTKRPEAERLLKTAFQAEGEGLRLQTRVEGFGARGLSGGLSDGPRGSGAELDADIFAAMYPFLPLHFDVVMALIRRLARRTGGTGLRSAIRVVQDLLVDASHALPPGTIPIADRPFKRLACADDIFDTLRADIAKELPHVVEGVARVETHPVFGRDPLAVRTAKAIAALQPLDEFPRTADNLAALLYPAVGDPPLVEPVRALLQQLVETRELGIVELKGEQDSDQAGTTGYLFLSDRVRPLQQTRDNHRPTGAEKRQLEIELLRVLFDPRPEARLENIKTVPAGLALGQTPVTGEGSDLRFLIEPVSAQSRSRRGEELLNETRVRADWQSSILWLMTSPPDLDELLEEACRSAHLVRSTPEHDADRDVAQYVRAERRRRERLTEAARARLAAALADGAFIFRGLARPVRELQPDSIVQACNAMLARAAPEVFPEFRHAPLAAKTNQASRFLEQDRLDRMPIDRDPLRLVETRAGQPRIKTAEPPLSVTLRTFKERLDAAGTGRLQGAFVQDLFAEPPYGWSKDTTRYLFAALLAAGEIEVHTPNGVLRTPGPGAEDAFRNTATFNRVGLALRGARPPLEALDRAARLIEGLFGIEVLPLEDHISRAVRSQVPPLMERVGSLPDRLRLLGLPGEGRARAVLQGCSDLLQEDAGGAASILGAPDNDLSADVRWARAAVDCLNGNAQGVGDGANSDEGETAIRRAGMLCRDLAELADLFPDLGELAVPEDFQTLAEVLAAESFPERMAELRTALFAVEQGLRTTYAEQRPRFAADTAQGLADLEAIPEWSALDQDDRDAITARLDLADLPLESDNDRPAFDLRRLLTRAARLPTTLADCRAEVRRRIPITPPGESDRDKTPAPQVVALHALMPADPLDTAEAVERWLQSLRQRLTDLIELGPVRLVVREDD
jgi:hypothetical protein